jgi:hypothetical protein
MPDQLNKQAIVNLLIDSPLREPIKINLIDIVNNTPEPDLPKIFPTITKELEIFQKATERRMKLADETIAKLGGTTAPEVKPAEAPVTTPPVEATPTESAPPAGLTAPTPDLPPLPTAASTAPAPEPAPALETNLPPSSEAPAPAPLPTPEPLGGAAPTGQGDEAALAEIQKELDSLKTASADEITAAAAPAPAAPPAQA